MARKYRNIIRAIYGTEWAILPDKLEEIQELMQLRAAGVTLSKEEIAARIGTVQAPDNFASGKIAVLNLFGTISQRMNMMSEFSGGTSTEMFSKAFIEARDNPEVTAILINADTPGGSVPGVPEASQLIYDARGIKPIKTLVNPMMASAGIWIGTAADEVIAIPSASDIGSIGVLTMHTDQSQADEQDGMKTTIITSNEFKAEGNPYEPLGQAALDHYKSRVMSIHHEFVEAVARNRGVTTTKVETDFGNGRTLRAKEALQSGLIDRIATLDEVLAELGSVAGSGSRVSVAISPQTVNAKGSQMDAKVKLELVKAGLCRATDDKAATQAALELHCEAAGIDMGNVAEVLQSFGQSTPTIVETEDTASVTVTAPSISQTEMISTVKVSGLPSDKQLDLITTLTPQLPTLSLQGVLDRVNAAKREEQETVGLQAEPAVTKSETDKFQAAARDALVMREFGSNLPNQVYDYQSGEYVDFKPGRPQHGLMHSMKLAEACLIQAGIPHSKIASMAPMNIARLVMGADPRQMGLGMLASSDGAAYNVSGMFSNILLDAANVTLRRSYDDARTTFQIWMRQAPSLADFKLTHAAIAGELGDPKAIPEDGEFEEVSMSDGKEQYRVTTWGSMFSLSWEAIVNDALGSFMEAPAKMGRSMRRKQNRIAYGVVNDNSALQTDSVALFHSSHNNRQTGANSDAAALKAKWAIAERKMAEQTGLDADSGALNYEPRWLVVPPALVDNAMTALNSQSLHTSNPGVTNTKQGAYELVKDAQMGAAQGGSDTRYILAADHADVDTIVYAYLQGLEAPIIEQETSFTSLSIKRRMYQAFGVKALDFRGLQDDTGA